MPEFASERNRRLFLQDALGFEPYAQNVLNNLDVSGTPALAAIETVQHFLRHRRERMDSGRIRANTTGCAIDYSLNPATHRHNPYICIKQLLITLLF